MFETELMRTQRNAAMRNMAGDVLVWICGIIVAFAFGGIVAMLTL